MGLHTFLRQYRQISIIWSRNTECSAMIKNPNVWLLIFKRACFDGQNRLFCTTKSSVLLLVFILFGKEKLRAFQIFGSVYAHGFHVSKSYFYLKSILQPAQLFQTFGEFER